MNARVLTWSVAVVAALAMTLVLPYRLTDGDSCAYAAMAHDIAVGRTPWTAPQWDFHGQAFGLTEFACFHDHPPGALWLAALVERCGARVENAALAANALWTIAAVAGVIAIARRFTSQAKAEVAGLVFLLHWGVMHYVQRAALELPLAATASWAIAAGLRLGQHRAWTLVAAAGVAGAVLTRGVLGLVPAGLLVLMLFDARLRPPWTRLAVALVLAGGALWAFDRAHASHFGGMHGAPVHGFWTEYFRRQVAPSLGEGGSSHSVEGPTAVYYFTRFLAYSLPWSLLVLWRLVRGPRPSPEAWKLCAVWIGVVLVGLSFGSREGSRYFFQTFVATSVLFALALPREPSANSAWVVATLLALALPSQVLLKFGFRLRDEWAKTAEIAAEHRYRPTPGESHPQARGPTVRGPFQPEDDRLKSMLRFHLDAWVSSAPVTEMRGRQWVPGAGEDFPVGKVVFVTPLGALVDYGR